MLGTGDQDVNMLRVLTQLIALPVAVLMLIVVASAVKAIIEDHGGKKNV